MSTMTPGDLTSPSLLDRVETSIADGLLPVEIFNDEEIFRAELDQVFGTCWVFVAHETEIPNAGDFVQRRIGIDPVIVTRDGSGGINVLSNYCRHRGTQVCQTDAGNSRFFQCPYHGWTYSNNGDLVGTPHLKDAYGERPDGREWGLMRAPRVATRQGFVFASLAEDGPALDEYLVGAGWMLDLITNGGMRVAGPPERYRVKANWKIAAENFAGDTYHVDSLHQSTAEIGITANLQKTSENGRLYDFGNGHAFIGHERPDFSGYPPEIVEKLDLTGLDEAQLQVLSNEPPTTGTIFPNLSMIRMYRPDLPGGEPRIMTSFRQWQPIGPGEMEIWNWQFVWDFMSEQEARDAYVNGQFHFGSAGVFEQDDTVAWEGSPRAAASPWMRREGMLYNYRQSKTSPVVRSPDPEYRGPGIKRNSGYGEHNQLNFYRHWLRTMRLGAEATSSAPTFEEN